VKASHAKGGHTQWVGLSPAKARNLAMRRRRLSHGLGASGSNLGCGHRLVGNPGAIEGVITNYKMMETISPPSNGFAIRAESVSRHFQMGQTLIRAVDEVTLSVRKGEFMGLLGSSGSGKSTLLNLMAGLDRPTSGAIIADGRNLAEMSSRELARYRNQTVGIVFQAFNLLPRMTLEENVELPLRLAEVDRGERAARVREALERVHLEKRSAHRPGELSGGEQQRAAIARALVNRPAILYADEPTGNLDSVTGEEILNLLREINQTLAATIVLVTHERILAEQFAERIAFLQDGKLVAA
jgi:putative ABC transport system ATP-binding protein